MSGWAERNLVAEVREEVMHSFGWSARSIMSESGFGTCDGQLDQGRVVNLEVVLGWVAVDEVLCSVGCLVQSAAISPLNPLPIIQRGCDHCPDPPAMEVDQGFDAAPALSNHSIVSSSSFLRTTVFQSSSSKVTRQRRTLSRIGRASGFVLNHVVSAASMLVSRAARSSSDITAPYAKLMW